MIKYVVLLRGINVGGKNTVSMEKLKLYLEELGYKNIKSYINSGNILLESDKTHKEIADQIEKVLPIKFNLDSNIVRVLILSNKDLKEIISKAPKGFGTIPTKYHSDVIFLLGVSSEEALKVFSPKEKIDRIWPGNGVIYSERLSAERTKSRLNRIIGTSVYKSMTIRNWNTATKLLKLLEEM